LSICSLSLSLSLFPYPSLRLLLAFPFFRSSRSSSSSLSHSLFLSLSLSLSLSLGGAGSFLGTAPLLPSGVTAPTDSGCSLAGTLVHSGGQRSDGGRRTAETPESRPVSWLPGGSRLHRSCAGAAILHSFGSMTVVHELSRVSWLRAASSPAGLCYPPAVPPTPLPPLSSYPCRFLPLSMRALSPLARSPRCVCALAPPRIPDPPMRPPLYNSQQLHTLTLRTRPEASRALRYSGRFLAHAIAPRTNESLGRAESRRTVSEHRNSAFKAEDNNGNVSYRRATTTCTGTCDRWCTRVHRRSQQRYVFLIASRVSAIGVSAHFGSTRPGPARPGSARLGSAQLPQKNKGARGTRAAVKIMREHPCAFRVSRVETREEPISSSSRSRSRCIPRDATLSFLFCHLVSYR